MASTAPASGGDVEVHGDDANDAFSGTGGLLLPGSVDNRTRTTVASCRGCEWRLESPCTDTHRGTLFDSQAPCLSVVRGCPAGDRLMRSWFRAEGSAWREIGLICLRRSGPVTVAQVDRQVRERFVEGMPALAPAFQPSMNPVAQIPVVFSSGQPGGTEDSAFTIIGLPVDLFARPTWVWRFGDGSATRTDDPGGRYPLSGVAHAYRAAGTYSVLVRTEWSASFTVDGLGPFPVTEPVSQEDRFAVVVGEGRALLRP